MYQQSKAAIGDGCTSHCISLSMDYVHALWSGFCTQERDVRLMLFTQTETHTLCRTTDPVAHLFKRAIAQFARL